MLRSGNYGSLETVMMLSPVGIKPGAERHIMTFSSRVGLSLSGATPFFNPSINSSPSLTSFISLSIHLLSRDCSSTLFDFLPTLQTSEGLEEIWISRR